MITFADGGDLGATAFVQLTPNDSEKIIYVRNNLAGSRSIILFQGTYNASNDYEVPAGTTAVIYFDGAGSGAVAANVFNNAYFDSLRLGGVSVTAIIDDDTMGTATATNIATSESIKAYVDAQVGANNELSEVLSNGNTTGGTDIAVSTGDDITFADSSKAIFGAGSDLQIYHDGSASYIDDAGSGRLNIRTNDLRIEKYTGETIAKFIADGAVELNYNDVKKLETTNTGVDITGTLTSDGLTVSGIGVVAELERTDADTILGLKRSGAVQGYLGANTSGDIRFYNVSAAIKLNLASNGDISFYEDTGTTPKFFWDASAESLGIGTSSPTNTSGLEIQTSSTTAGLWVQTGGTTSSYNIAEFRTGSNLDALKIRGDGSSIFQGNVGIGTSSPYKSLTVGETDATAWITSGGSNVHLTVSPNGASGSFIVRTGGTNGDPSTTTEAMRIDSSGNVGIGTSSPSAKLDINQSSASTGLEVYVNDTGTSKIADLKGYDNTLGVVSRMVVQANGNVGIGTSSPSYKMTINTSDEDHLRLENGSELGVVRVMDSGALDFWVHGANSTDVMTFTNGTGVGSERMRIDSSGNLLVGKTTFDATTEGSIVRGTGSGIFVADGNDALLLNRLTSDGSIIEFRKDGTTVGSIGSVVGSYLSIGQGDTGILFQDDNDFIEPCNVSTSSGRDAAISLGTAGGRFKDLYLSGGVYLGGTGAANKLDDYEEGYGVSAFTTTGGSVTINSSFNRIFYTKVGRQVLLSGRISVASVSSPTGLLQITIPFTCANLDHDPSAAVYLAVNGIASGDIGDFWAEIPEGGNTINVYRTGSNYVSNSAAGFMISGSDIRILASYIAA
jgi:hypothetical protein